MSAPRKTRTPIRWAKIRLHLDAGCPSFKTRDGQARPCNGIGCQVNYYAGARRTSNRRKRAALR